MLVLLKIMLFVFQDHITYDRAVGIVKTGHKVRRKKMLASRFETAKTSLLYKDPDLECCGGSRRMWGCHEAAHGDRLSCVYV
jgi:hypothetical protein